METKYFYSFGGNKADGNAKMKELLGGKGAGLAEMSKIGLPVPPGFTISTEVCTYYTNNNKEFPKKFNEELILYLSIVENLQSKKFGSKSNPLLLSIRSGARVSMPGMMDTILNLGLNDESVIGLFETTKNERFAYDSYRRFIQMFGSIVLDIEHKEFEKLLFKQKELQKVTLDCQLNVDSLKNLVKNYKKLIFEKSGKDFPQDPYTQLNQAIEAVMKSWNNQRAITYRKINDIPSSWGTAVNVMSMVFGNKGDDSATGVCFTRDPGTGEKHFFGEFLVNAQGEDVVAGIRTPHQITEFSKSLNKSNLPSMEEVFPELYKELCEITNRLELHYKDMQDIEFTIESGKLYILQNRSGKRTGQAAVKIAVDMFNEGILDEKEALLLIPPLSINHLLHSRVDPNAPKTILSSGLPASPGAAFGKIILDAHKAEQKAKEGELVILVREETCPDDIHGMHAAKGILTSRGGMTSHAAVVARGMGCPCICGAGSVVINHSNNTLKIGKFEFKEGDEITIDGSTGEIYLGKVQFIDPIPSEEFKLVMKWADKYRKLKIRSNAETVKDINSSIKFGAEGIGLVRTEHMFFEPDRILAVRKLLLASDNEDKLEARKLILPYQIQDFTYIFESMKELPVTIRLLDPPVHEFLPKEEKDIIDLSKNSKYSVDEIKERIQIERESNPMLGNRGCRLGITRIDITELQVEAIFFAADKVSRELNIEIHPEIMIPITITKKEIEILKNKISEIYERMKKENGICIKYVVGTMIELPRACLIADELAEECEFFSFGTNDLTQTCLGISRDDFTFYEHYKKLGILDSNPFSTLDEKGVGELMKMAVTKGRKIKEKLKIGICGEHGGDPKSIMFCDKLGLDYVSCSPFRIYIAKLAAAQANIINNKS